jgi:hypothetical protein
MCHQNVWEYDINKSHHTWRYPHIASVSDVTHEFEMGYLKFVKDDRKEIEILQYLTGIISPSNHTISGDVISMPMAGC